MKAPLYQEIKAREARHCRRMIKQRGSHSAMAKQRQVSFVGNGSKWRITNFSQVMKAMEIWAS